MYIGILVAVSPDRLSVWLAFSPVIAATGLNGVYAAFLTAERRYALAILRVPLGTGIALAVAAIVLPFWETPTALAIAVSAGQLATLALLAVQARGAPSGTGESISASSLFASSSAVFASTLLGGQLVIVVERFLASGLVVGAVALLAYARGIALLPVMFAQAVGSGMFPAAAERFKAPERDALVRLAVNGMRLSALAGLVSTAYVVICRRELVQVAFERHAFTSTVRGHDGDPGRDPRRSAHRCVTHRERRAHALRAREEARGAGDQRRGARPVRGAAVVLREAYGLNGLASAFTVASTAGGLVLAAVLVRRLGVGVARVVREWVVAPAALAAAFTGGALAVWLPFGGTHPGFTAALGAAVAVGLGGLAVLALAIRLTRGLEYTLLERALTPAGGR